MSRVIKIVTIGNKIGAVKMGKCPMYAIADKSKADDFKASLKEDFPDYVFENAQSKDRENLARFLIQKQKMR